jgi:hypothetical protein
MEWAVEVRAASVILAKARAATSDAVLRGARAFRPGDLDRAGAAHPAGLTAKSSDGCPPAVLQPLLQR